MNFLAKVVAGLKSGLAGSFIFIDIEIGPRMVYFGGLSIIELISIR